MKVFKPVVISFAALVVASLTFGVVFDAFGITVSFSTTFYLLICFVQIVHSLEEYATKFWVHIADTPLFAFRERSQTREPAMDRSFFVAFNIVLNMVMLFFYWPISLGASWSWVFGIGMASLSVGNGILHWGTALIRWEYFSGCVSGVFTFVAGTLMLTSLSLHL
jgi:hypothetical protein